MFSFILSKKNFYVLTNLFFKAAYRRGSIYPKNYLVMILLVSNFFFLIYISSRFILFHVSIISFLFVCLNLARVSVIIFSWYGFYIQPAFPKNLKFFFLLKFNIVCTFWIVLMCWCQKWFLKNKKILLACILVRKVIWKTPATTLWNTL